MNRLTTIDAARGIASVLVMLYHCNSVVQSPIYFGDQPFGGFFGSGAVRMPFFFAMSGFMLMLVHGGDIGRPERLRRYVLGRFTRIYPTYWAVLALVIPAYLVRASMGAEAEPVTVWTIVGAILLFPQPSVPFLVVAWTLQSLMIFYAVAALAIWRRWVGAVAFVLWQGAALGALIFHVQPGFPAGFLLQSLSLDLFLGGLAAVLVSRHRVRHPMPWIVFGAAYLAVSLVQEFRGHPLLPWDWPIVANGAAASAVLVGMAVWERSRPAPVRVPRLLLACGAASYSIFLIHYPLLSVLSKVGKAAGLGRWLNGEAIFLVFAACCVLAGILFHRWLERPLTAWVQARVGVGRRSPGQSVMVGLGTMKGTRE
jgi:peptidoglycan/LPS O-acetylase OafA/YrhL